MENANDGNRNIITKISVNIWSTFLDIALKKLILQKYLRTAYCIMLSSTTISIDRLNEISLSLRTNLSLRQCNPYSSF